VRGPHVLRLTIGSSLASLDRQGRALSQPPIVVRGRTMIPLREVARLMEAEVQYNPASRVVFITLPQGSLAQPTPTAQSRVL